MTSTSWLESEPCASTSELGSAIGAFFSSVAMMAREKGESTRDGILGRWFLLLSDFAYALSTIRSECEKRSEQQKVGQSAIEEKKARQQSSNREMSRAEQLSCDRRRRDKVVSRFLYHRQLRGELSCLSACDGPQHLTPSSPYLEPSLHKKTYHPPKPDAPGKVPHQHPVPIPVPCSCSCTSPSIGVPDPGNRYRGF